MSVTESAIRLFARYSEGCRLAATHGPTSGVVFEYACENTPRGSGVFGRLIDREFLRLAAWQNLRQRSEVTREIVENFVTRRRAVGRKTAILDVASGTARYLRQFAREHGDAGVSMACRDRDPRQVAEGRELSRREGLTRMTFSVGDATDQASYLTDGDADLILAVGLFPHLQKDEDVRVVMRLAYEHLTPGGCFVCTTVCEPDAPLYPWETGYRKRAIVRPAGVVAAWLRALGFAAVEERHSAADCFLVARKPGEG